VKIGDFPLVETLINARGHLIHLKDHGKIVIQIDRAAMVPDFVESVRPAIALELRHRITEIERQLRDLGVILE
jgi:hypothetical protein